MPKTTSQYICQECGYISPSYLGKCPECNSWGSLIEEITQKKSSRTSSLNDSGNSLSLISDIDLSNIERISTTIKNS